jgi:uncharacterized membrane protein YadS
LVRTVPGVALLFVVGYAGKFTEQWLAAYGKAHHLTLPNIANLSRWAFLLTFAGVGLRTDLRELSGQGWRPLAVGVIGEVAIAGLTLAMVVAAARRFAF